MIKYVIYSNETIKRQVVCLHEEIGLYISGDLEYVQHDGAIAGMKIIDGQVVPQ